MPHLRIETNVTKTKIPQDFVTKAIPVLAGTLGKPTQFCVVSIVSDVSMCFGGSTDPCATASLMSIGSLGVEQNKKHSKVLYDFIEKELGIPKDRQRLYTENEIQSVLANQKRMFEAKQLQEQTRSIIPSHAGTSSAGPSSAGPYMKNQNWNQAQRSRSRSKSTTPSSTGPSSAGTSSAGPYTKNQNWNQAQRSRSRSKSTTPSSAGPYRRNQNRNQAQRSRSRSRHNVKHNVRHLNYIVNCVTCNGQLSHHIYQCTNGHSSCEGCRFKMVRCGNCSELITDMRNITLESTLADLTINTEERIKCSNAKEGCCLHFKKEELQNHLKECPFNIISCPVMEFSGDCCWRGTIKQLGTHFNEEHPKHREGDVNKEMHIIVIDIDYKVMHLVNIGLHQFLVHIQLDTSLNNIYMVTQYLGTNFSASKWTYEWHVYNKKEPRRKFEYIDICKSNATPVSELVNNNNCAIMNINYAKTFLDNGKLTFKFYIKKQFDNKQNVETTSN